MNYQIQERKILEDKTIDLIIKIDPKDQILFCFILEAWEGVFNYTTVDKKNSLINLRIAEDFAEEADQLLTYLQNH
ncbi:DUF4911 domain-containing protein [bacterium]|nr:DUF4911 domain-containing protein [bacterium]